MEKPSGRRIRRKSDSIRRVSACADGSARAASIGVAHRTKAEPGGRAAGRAAAAAAAAVRLGERSPCRLSPAPCRLSPRRRYCWPPAWWRIGGQERRCGRRLYPHFRRCDRRGRRSRFARRESRDHHAAASRAVARPPGATARAAERETGPGARLRSRTALSRTAWSRTRLRMARADAGGRSSASWRAKSPCCRAIGIGSPRSPGALRRRCGGSSRPRASSRRASARGARGRLSLSVGRRRRFAGL